MRPIAVLVPLFLLGACALPAVYSIATLAVDGISYATSGKGVTDHALSAVANEDCAMWRVLVARPICRPADVPQTTVAAAPAAGESEVLAMMLGVAPAAGGGRAPEILVASATEFGEFELTAAAFAALPAADESEVAEAMVIAAPEPDVVPDGVPDGSEVMEALAVAPAAGDAIDPETGTTEVPTKAETPAETPTTSTAAPADRETAAKPVQLAALVAPLPNMKAKPNPKPARFVVLASYLKEAHARVAMKRGREFQPRMARVRVRGKLYYRVVSGPYARGAIGAMRRTMIGGGFPDAWTAKLCQDTLRLAPCPTAPLPLNVTTN